MEYYVWRQNESTSLEYFNEICKYRQETQKECKNDFQFGEQVRFNWLFAWLLKLQCLGTTPTAYFKFSMSVFCLQSVFMSIVRLSEHTATISWTALSNWHF
jgi:hypothetical protein